MKCLDLPLPTPEEVVLCNQHTTVEEVSLLWKRAIRDPDKYRIFCLVHAEKLSYQVCDKAIRELNEVMQGKTGQYMYMYMYGQLTTTFTLQYIVCTYLK